MINKKWLVVLTLPIYLTISGVALGQNFRLPPNERVAVISLVPRNGNEFENIYGRRPSRVENIDMAKTRHQLAQMNQPALEVYPSARSNSGFTDFVRNAQEQIVMVIGHNVNGHLQFVDGSSMNVANMVALTRKQDKGLILLSCDANNYVPPYYPAASGTLRNQDAMKMVESIGTSAARNSSFSDYPSIRGNSLLDLAQSDITRVETLGDIMSSVRLAVPAGAAIIGGSYIIERRRKHRGK